MTMRSRLRYGFPNRRRLRRVKRRLALSTSGSASRRLLFESLEDRLLLALDFGDAPVGYPTTLAEDGARHEATGLRLGASRDTEADGTHSADADADGLDEDGVTFGTVRVGQLDATVTVDVLGSGKLDAWIDFNGDGSWGGPFEHVFDSKVISGSGNVLTFDVPSWAVAGATYARFRLSTAGDLGVGGEAVDGEVEDHRLTIDPPTAASGIFTGPKEIDIGGDLDDPTSVFAADVNGDGHMDIVAASREPNMILWYENDGSEVFADHRVDGVGDDAQKPMSVFAADVNGDGETDVVSASRADEDITWFQNDGSENFTGATVFGGASIAQSVFVADVDADGDMDVLSAAAGSDDEIAWSDNDGSESFTYTAIPYDVDNASSVFAADVDSDGDMDVLYAAEGASGSEYDIGWLENDGSQSFTNHPISTDVDGATSVFAADMDGDGDTDVLSASFDDDKIVWHENNGDDPLTFTNHEITDTQNEANGARSVFAADMDGDGDMDVLSASEDDHKVAWYENMGSQVFEPHVIHTDDAQDPYSVFAADVDGDGDMDVISASFRDNKIAWYENHQGFVVNSTGDSSDDSLGDGVCDTGAMVGDDAECTLRAAIQEANATANSPGGPDRIHFDIAGAGPHTIQPASSLPTIADAVVIDGTSEPDFAGTPVVELDGTSAGATSGLELGAGAAGSTIRGLAINRFGYEGIDIIGGGNNTIQGNYLGTDVAGAVDQGNGYHGIWVSDSTSNQIGGTAVGAGNVISGNRYGVVIAGAGSTGNVVEGNRIGTNAAGAGAMPNDFHGVLIQNDATGNTIGGTATGSGNQISGNTRNGVKIIGATTTGNMVQGNLIGTDATGSAPLANVRHGIEITGGASSNTVGGTAAGAGNVISGNTRYGMLIGTAGTTGNVVEGNLIGTDAAGAVPLGNTLHGIVVNGGATGNTIGGTAAGAGNVISGNDRFGVVISNPPTTGNVFAGNLIGTNATGSAALRNDFHGVLITGGAHSNTIGGTAAGAGNVISGNSLSGLKVVGAGTSGNLVQGNRIGTDAAGNVSLANGRDGVEISSSATGNTIGGTAAGASNVISGNTRYGVIINTATATGNVLEGNLIGTNAAGTGTLGNGEHGVVITLGAHTNTIGGTAAGAGNLISGNGNHGVFLNGDSNIVQGNLIGTNAAGSGPLGNAGSGVVAPGTNGNQIGGAAAGAGNAVAYNGVRGVVVSFGGTGNAIRRNSIHDNGGATRLGIDLNNDNATANDADDPDTGANNLQNFPEMVSATINGANLDVVYSIPSTAANSAFPITAEFFLADGSGAEGETYLGTHSYSEGTTPTATVPNGGAVAGTKIVATATDGNGNTSEFSASVTVVSPLLAAGGEASQKSRVEGQKLEADQLVPVVDAAIDRLVGAGFAAESFSNVQVAIADLPGATLGLATGDTITIDVDAAGYGWYVSPELKAPRPEPADSDAATVSGLSTLGSRLRMDLLTVVMHELGHTAGLADTYDIESEDDLMYAWLAAGERRTPNEAAVDRLFASSE